MPCDRVYTTTAMDLAKLDRPVLAQVLRQLGWSVALQADGSLYATGAYGSSLSVDATSATLMHSQYGQSAQSLQAAILQGYARAAVTAQAARFGFQVRNEAKLADGTLRITIGRTGNVAGGKAPAKRRI